VTADAHPSRTAYVDESLRISDGLYILAAVTIADRDADHHRAALRDLLYRRQVRLHWHDESSQRRRHLVAEFCGLEHAGVVVIAAGMAPGRQERARRKCIDQLLTQLVGQDTARVAFERRHRELDARDRAMVSALRRQQALPAAFGATWESPVDEPLLWLADIAAGAAALAETGDDGYWRDLSAAFSIERLTLD
jgi:hypothetical protein